MGQLVIVDEDELNKWIPIKTRPLTDEEIEIYYDEYSATWVYACPLPEDNQEVLITNKYGYVCQTTFYSDDICYFEDYEDEDDVLAWMTLPKPYKRGGEYD